MYDSCKMYRPSCKYFFEALLSIIAPGFLFLPFSLTYSIPELVSNILNDKVLLNCEVMFVQTQISYSESTFDSNSAITEDISSNQNPLALPKLNLYSTSSGTFTVKMGEKSITDNQLVFRRLNDIHRFNSKNCGVAVMYISKIVPDLTNRLFKIIIPRYLPIIRKDEDYFVFVFNNNAEANEILLSPEFGNKIKFKIGIIKPSEVSLQPEIKQVDMYGENGKCVVQNVPLALSTMDTLFIDKNNFNGKLFRVVNPKAPSYFEMEPEGNGKLTYRPVRGLYKKWLDVMMERFNFTIELHLSSASGSTGKRLKNGTWVGSVGDILSGRADMASFNGHIHNRHEFVDWSAPLTYEWMVFITHKQKSFFSASAIYRPFPITLWIGFVLAVVVICITFKLISKYASQSILTIDFKDMIMFIFSSFMEQDAQYYLEVLHLHSVRVLTSFWFLFAVVLSTAYRGKLVSLIAFPALSWIPSTFDELAYSNYRVGLNVFGKGGATYAVLSTSKSPVYQTFFKRMELYPNPVHCLNEAFHDDFGCLMVKSVADFFGAKNFTDKSGRNPFKASEQTALFREDGYIWEKRAIFRNHFDKKTWSLMETGLTNLWFQNDLYNVKKKRLDWERENPNANSTLTITANNEGPSKLQIVHLTGLFYLYILGHLLGFFSVIYEKLHAFKKNWEGLLNRRSRKRKRHPKMPQIILIN